MGALFKAMAISSPKLPSLAGFGMLKGSSGPF
jgi:hypothetical protein